MLAELYGKGGGACQGKGGSMHIADFSIGMLGANGVVAANIAIGVGAAHGAKLKGEDKVVVCFFGDGAINRGPFLEGLNWAKVFELPILFVCEDNGFAATTRTEAMSAGPGPDARARSLGVPATACDGNDVGDVDATASELLQRVRGGAGPQFLLARTYRLKGHTAADAAPYRPASEVEEKLGEDPLARCGEALRVAGVAANELVAIEEEARAEIARAVAAAEGAAWPDQALAFADVQDVGRPAWRR